MQHGQNMDEVTPHSIEQAIREAREKSAANIGNYFGIKQGCLRQPF